MSNASASVTLPWARAVCAAARSPSTQSASSARSAFCLAPTPRQAICFACRLCALMTPAHTPNARRILDVLASWHLEDDLIASDGGVARLAIVTLIAWIAAVAVPLATDH